MLRKLAASKTIYPLESQFERYQPMIQVPQIKNVAVVLYKITQIAGVVPPVMPIQLIVTVPEAHQGRDHKDKNSIGPQHITQLSYGFGIVIDVLHYVKGSDQVKAQPTVCRMPQRHGMDAISTGIFSGNERFVGFDSLDCAEPGEIGKEKTVSATDIEDVYIVPMNIRFDDSQQDKSS